MPRKRMIDPSFWRDEKIAKCSYMERLLFEGLWTFAEDSGVGRASPLLIKADVFPYDTLREADIQSSLAKMASLGLILLYERDGQQYYFISNFKKHQTINNPSRSYLPVPLPEDYGSTTVVLPTEDNISKEEVKLKEDKEKGALPRFCPPAFDEVRAYCQERSNGIDPEAFIAFYESKGWKVGNQPMKSWKSAVITWEKRNGGGRAGSSGLDKSVKAGAGEWNGYKLDY